LRKGTDGRLTLKKTGLGRQKIVDARLEVKQGKRISIRTPIKGRYESENQEKDRP